MPRTIHSIRKCRWWRNGITGTKEPGLEEARRRQPLHGLQLTLLERAN